MNFIKLTDPLGAPAYLNPAEVVCISQQKSVTRIHLRAGTKWIQVRESSGDVARRIEEATRGREGQ